MPRSDLVFLPSVHEAPSCAPCLAQIWSFFPLYTKLSPHVWLRSGLSSLCTRGSCPMSDSDMVFVPSIHEALAPCLAQIWSFFPLYMRLLPHASLRSGLCSLYTRSSCPMSGSDLVFLPSVHEAPTPCLAQIWSFFPLYMRLLPNASHRFGLSSLCTRGSCPMSGSDLVFLPSVHEAPAPYLAQIWSLFPLYTKLLPHVWLRSGLSSLCTRGSCPMSGSDLVFVPSIHEALAPCLAQIWSFFPLYMRLLPNASHRSGLCSLYTRSSCPMSGSDLVFLPSVHEAPAPCLAQIWSFFPLYTRLLPHVWLRSGLSSLCTRGCYPMSGSDLVFLPSVYEVPAPCLAQIWSFFPLYTKLLPHVWLRSGLCSLYTRSSCPMSGSDLVFLPSVHEAPAPCLAQIWSLFPLYTKLLPHVWLRSGLSSLCT